MAMIFCLSWFIYVKGLAGDGGVFDEVLFGNEGENRVHESVPAAVEDWMMTEMGHRACG